MTIPPVYPGDGFVDLLLAEVEAVGVIRVTPGVFYNPGIGCFLNVGWRKAFRLPGKIALSALVHRYRAGQQEDEANWLSGCLLLPRPALLFIMQSAMDQEEACRRYKVSDDLLTYRPEPLE